MTTDEIRDWLRERDGWKATHFGGWMNANGALSSDDPFPATVDGAKSAMPPDWTWLKELRESDGVCVWSAWPKAFSFVVEVLCTGDEIHDRYLLAKLAWEAMA